MATALSELKRLSGIVEDQSKWFTATVMGIDIRMSLITGAEAALVSEHFRRTNDDDGKVSSLEWRIEHLVYAIREINGEPWLGMAASEEEKDQLRELLASIPSPILAHLHHTYIQNEMGMDSEIGVTQLRNMLLTIVLTQVASFIDFPIMLADLIRAVSSQETPAEIVTEMLKLKGQYALAVRPAVQEGTQDAPETEVAQDTTPPPTEQESASSVADETTVDPVQVAAIQRTREAAVRALAKSPEEKIADELRGSR